jgi:hypothetical protein
LEPSRNFTVAVRISIVSVTVAKVIVSTPVQVSFSFPHCLDCSLH